MTLTESCCFSAFFIIAQMPTTYTCYSSGDNYFLLQEHFSDSGVDYYIILKYVKNTRACDYNTQDLKSIYVFKYKLLISLTEIGCFQDA